MIGTTETENCPEPASIHIRAFFDSLFSPSFLGTCAQDRFLRGEALKLDIDDKFTVTQNEAHEEALRSVEETLKRGPTAAPNTIPFVPCSKITFLTEGSYAYFSNPGYPNGPKPNTR